MSGLSKFSLKDKVVVITGATGVLGAALSLAIARAGAKVAIIGTHNKRTGERAAMIREEGGHAIGIIADVLIEKQMQAAKNIILNKWGSISGLVNVVGSRMSGFTSALAQELFKGKIMETIQSVNLPLYGTILPTQVFGGGMAEKGRGVIINIIFLAVQRAVMTTREYTSVKKAVENYTQWLAVDLGMQYGSKLRVNAIAPGIFLTDQIRSLFLRKDGTYSKTTDDFIIHTPYQWLEDPEELTGSLIYLLSDASVFVNGETLLIDGGFNAYNRGATLNFPTPLLPAPQIF